MVTGNAPFRPKKPRWTGSRFPQKKRVCFFCRDKVTQIDYKDPAKFGRYVSDRAKIEPRRRTGTCARHQRMLATAIKRARHLALLPFVPEHVRVSGVVMTGIAAPPLVAVAPAAGEPPAKMKPAAQEAAPPEAAAGETAPEKAE